MNKNITIEDIARQVGVSPSTVSRVLTGSKRVSDDKRELVLAAVAQHQYRPNAMARGLVRGRSMIVGVLVQDIASPFFAKMVSGIEQGLAPTSYRPMLTTTHWRTQEREDEVGSLQLLLEHRTDGVIVLGGPYSRRRTACGRSAGAHGDCRAPRPGAGVAVLIRRQRGRSVPCDPLLNAASSGLFCNEFYLFAAVVGMDTFDQFGCGQFAFWLDNGLFTMEPLRLDRVQPGTFHR